MRAYKIVQVTQSGHLGSVSLTPKHKFWTQYKLGPVKNYAKVAGTDLFVFESEAAAREWLRVKDSRNQIWLVETGVLRPGYWLAQGWDLIEDYWDKKLPMYRQWEAPHGTLATDWVTMLRQVG